MEHIIEVPADLIDTAIDRRVAALAASVGRHEEWLRRRIREAVKFVSEHSANDAAFHTYWEIAEPVFVEAAIIARRKVSDFKIGSVH
jgi:hypothetical protein